MDDYKKKPSGERIWEKYYPDSAKDFEYPRMTVYDLVYEENRNRKDNIALEYEGREICYGEFFDEVEKKTDYLMSKGIKEDDVVTVSMLMTPEFVYDWYALGRINAISNLIDPRTSYDGIKKYLEEADSQYILNTNLFLPKIKKAIGENDSYHVINYSLSQSSSKMPFTLGTLSFVMDKYGNYVSNVDHRIENYNGCMKKNGGNLLIPDYIEDKALTIVHTGGTTGFPKGVVLSHDNYNAMAYEYMKSQIGFSPKDRFLLIMPPWISYGSGMLHMSLVTGMKATIISKLDSKKMPQYLLKYHPQWFAGVPAHYRIIANSKLIPGSDLSFLKAGAVGGDAMPAELYNSVNNVLLENGALKGVYPGYALTEVTSAFAVKQLGDYKPGSVGFPLPGCTVGIFKYDEENEVTLDEELEYGQMGEVCLLTPNKMLGYYKNSNLDSTVLREHSDGKTWVHTGDLGHIDKDGFLYIDGRIKEMITRHDGFKVYPFLIEEIINSNESVAASKVVGVEDTMHMQGEIPKVYIVLKSECIHDEKRVLKEVKSACIYRLPKYYTENCIFEVIDKLPLTSLGKVDFQTLKKSNAETKKLIKKR